MLDQIFLHITKKVIDAFWPKSKEHSKNEDSSNESSIFEQVEKYKRVMRAHGMRPEHWPRFFKECGAPFTIKRTDQASNEALLNWIDDEKIDWICDVFQLNRSWLDSEESSRPHVAHMFGNHPEDFFQTVTEELQRKPNYLEHDSAEAIFALNSVEKYAEENEGVRIMVAVAIPICRLSNEVTVYRYLHDYTVGGYPWYSAKYRPQVKIFARLFHLHFKVWIRGLYFTKKHFDAVESGELLLPEALAEPGQAHCSWHPEDYALAPSESTQAKEPQLLQHSLDWMQELDLPNSNTIQRIPS